MSALITISQVLILLMIVIHIYTVVLEMFLWTKPVGLRVFRQSLERAQASAVLAANQGLYNGFLVAGLIWSLVHPDPAFAWQLQVFFAGCVLISGLYGGWSVGKKIFYVQGLPALLALVLLTFTRV